MSDVEEDWMKLAEKDVSEIVVPSSQFG